MVDKGTDKRRRKILRSFLYSLCITLPSFPGNRILASVNSLGSLESDLVKFLGQPDSAKVIGQEYLLSTPNENNKQRLTALIFHNLSLAPTYPLRKQSADLRTLIQLRIRKDFADEDVVFVKGWMLARTEVRLYALAALT